MSSIVRIIGGRSPESLEDQLLPVMREVSSTIDRNANLSKEELAAVVKFLDGVEALPAKHREKLSANAGRIKELEALIEKLKGDAGFFGGIFGNRKIREARAQLDAEKAKTEPLRVKEYEARLASLFAELGEERIVPASESALGRTPSAWEQRLESAYRRSEKELDLSDFADELRAIEAELRTQDGFLSDLGRKHQRLNDQDFIREGGLFVDGEKKARYVFWEAAGAALEQIRREPAQENALLRNGLDRLRALITAELQGNAEYRAAADTIAEQNQAIGATSPLVNGMDSVADRAERAASLVEERAEAQVRLLRTEREIPEAEAAADRARAVVPPLRDAEQRAQTRVAEFRRDVEEAQGDLNGARGRLERVTRALAKLDESIASLRAELERAQKGDGQPVDIPVPRNADEARALFLQAKKAAAAIEKGETVSPEDAKLAPHADWYQKAWRALRAGEEVPALPGGGGGDPQVIEKLARELQAAKERKAKFEARSNVRELTGQVERAERKVHQRTDRLRQAESELRGASAQLQTAVSHASTASRRVDELRDDAQRLHGSINQLGRQARSALEAAAREADTLQDEYDRAVAAAASLGKSLAPFPAFSFPRSEEIAEIFGPGAMRDAREDAGRLRQEAGKARLVESSANAVISGARSVASQARNRQQVMEQSRFNALMGR